MIKRLLNLLAPKLRGKLGVVKMRKSPVWTPRFGPHIYRPPA